MFGKPAIDPLSVLLELRAQLPKDGKPAVLHAKLERGSYGGLTYYKDGRFTSWTEKDGLPGSTVRALKLDGDGTLWIGTYDSGLGRFRDGRFTRFTIREGLFDNGVFQILEEHDSFFRCSVLLVQHQNERLGQHYRA